MARTTRTDDLPGNNGSDLADLFVLLGREFSNEDSVERLLEMISWRAFEVIPSAEHAAVSMGRKGRFETVAPTSDLPPRVDRIQYELGTGPCVDAAVENSVYRVGDLARATEWPEFGRQAAEKYGIRSMLSVRIFVNGDGVIAGLNLYSSAVDAFDESDQTTATLLATHGGLALTAAHRQGKIENLERALLNSRRIGMAIGILMATNKVTDQQAFDLLRIASQSKHRKLYDIAEDVVRTGQLELPKLPEVRKRR